MIKVLAILALSFGAMSAHAVQIDSAYPIGTTGDMYAKCTQEGTNVDGFDSYTCPLTKEADDAGYRLTYACYDHGCGFDLAYNSESVQLYKDPIDMGTLSTKEYKLPANYEPTWHDGGIGSGAIEVRFTISKVNGKTVKTPFAVIYREVYNTYAGLINDQGEIKNETLATTQNGLIVVQLNGADSEVVGMIDALKSKKANEQARQCADSIVGKGDRSVCTSTLQPPFALD